MILPEEYAFFSYEVPAILGNYYMHFQATLGSDKIKLYASAANLYPSEDSYQWTSGILKNYRSAPEMFAKETFPDLEIFVLDEKNHMIHQPFLSPELIEGQFNFDKTSAVVKMDNESWRYGAKKCFLSCKNISDAPVTISLSAKCSAEFV